MLQPYEPRPNGLWRCYTLFLLAATASASSMSLYITRAAIACAVFSMVQVRVLGLPHPSIPGLQAPIPLPSGLSTSHSRVLLGVPEFPATAVLTVLLYAALHAPLQFNGHSSGDATLRAGSSDNACDIVASAGVATSKQWLPLASMRVSD